MKRNVVNQCLAAISLAVTGALPIWAQAGEEIFSGFPAGSPHGYSSGDVANFSIAYVNGSGAGGSLAAVLSMDFTSGPLGFGSAGYGYINSATGGNTSVNLNDYTLSFDAAVNVANAGFALQFHNDASSGSLASASDFLISTPNSFEHFDLNLGSAFTGYGGFDPRGSVWVIDFFTSNFDFGAPSIGDQLIFSNVQLTMVPEPSLGLCALCIITALASLRLRDSTPNHLGGAGVTAERS